MADRERRTVPIDEAIARLGDGDEIHTFMNPNGGMLFGADHSRAHLIEAMRRDGVEEAGEAACAMRHTLVIVRYQPTGAPLFIEAAPQPIEQKVAAS